MKKLRVVSYAINGRGLGHLVRQLAILRWVRRYAQLLGVACEAWILTTSEADTLARREGIPALKLPSKAMLRDAGIDGTRYLAIARQWVMNAVAGLAPDILVVDTFPGGSFGELLPVLETVPARVLVARAVKDAVASDDAYRALLPLYQRAIVPDERGVGPILLREREELLARPAARAALGVGDRRCVYVTLGGGGDEAAPRALPELCDALVARGWHVVVAAGPLYAGPERRGPNITWMDRYAPIELLHGVDAAVSAGGYNSVSELMFAGVPTVFLPQPRVADDQASRAREAAAAGAGRVAASLAEVPELLDAPGDAATARALVLHNGARAAAAEVLSVALPAADLAFAREVLAPERWGRAARHGSLAIDLCAAVAGPPPSALRERDAVLADLVAEGAIAAAPARRRGSASDRVDALLAIVDELGPPADVALAVVRGLRRAFPAATLDAVVDATGVWLRACAPFGDWMGAASLVGAVPAQRSVAIGDAAAAVASWLAHERDLFDALRKLARLAEHGARPLDEVLRKLAPAHHAAPAAAEREA